ncbi:hypothetical protein [Kribbella sp. NPDC050470]|uniref:hypothetical protein n=1 Tax=unclassified Kribbella TaxID=2644121 RepID=UPI003796FE12
MAATILAAGLLVAAAPSTAHGSTAGAAAACEVKAGAVTAGGDHWIQGFRATAPITRTENRVVARGLYPDGQARLSSSWEYGSHAELPGTIHSGLVTLGTVLYEHGYMMEPDGSGPFGSMDRIGGGWGAFKALDLSTVLTSSTTERWTGYGLRTDGILQRWNVTHNAGQPVWRPSGTATGFGAVKAMALISQTRTYDTFLMNTGSGGLYTVRIPTTTPMKPVVKKVRSSTWQGFESLVTARCGSTGTLLLGIDKDTGNGYLYAVGHGATVIKGLGKVPGTFTNPVNFSWRRDRDLPTGA